MAKLAINLGAAETPRNDDLKLTKAIEEFTTGLPSPGEADLRAKLRSRSQFSVSKVPTFLKEMFDARADELGMSKVEYLYHLMREDGLNVPAYHLLDRRNY
jgi:hypothetical protein